MNHPARFHSISGSGIVAISFGVVLLFSATFPAKGGPDCCPGSSAPAAGAGSVLKDFRDLFDRHIMAPRLRITVFPSPSIGRVELRDHTHGPINGQELFTLPMPENWTGAISTTVELPPDIHFSLSGFAPQSASGTPPVANASESGPVQQSSETAPPDNADENPEVDPTSSCYDPAKANTPATSSPASTGTSQTGSSSGPSQSGTGGGSGSAVSSSAQGLAQTFSAAMGIRAGNSVRVGLDMGVGFDGQPAPKLVFEVDPTVFSASAVPAASLKTALLRPSNFAIGEGIKHNTDGTGIGTVLTENGAIVQMRTKTGLAEVSSIPDGFRVSCYDYVDGYAGTLSRDTGTGRYDTSGLSPVNVWDFKKVAVAGQPGKVSIVRQRGANIVGNWSWTGSRAELSNGSGNGDSVLRDELAKTEESIATSASSYSEGSRIQEKRTPTETRRKVIWHHGPPITRPAPPTVTPPPAGSPPIVASAVNIAVTADAASESVAMQSDSGYFKKKTFYPAASAPNRRISILRSWLGVTLPGDADENNSDATVIDHTSLPQGWSRIWIHKLAGVQVEKVITASTTAGRTQGNIPEQPVETLTRVRYLGGSTIPITSVHEKFAKGAMARLIGRPVSSVGTDGSTEQYEYFFGTWTWDLDDCIFDELETGSDLKIERTRVAAGRTEREVTVENHDGRTLSRERFRGIAGGGSLPVSHDVYIHLHSANHSDWTTETKRKVSGGWRTTSTEVWSNYRHTSETDESGVTTTFGYTDGDDLPDVETRQLIPAANGLPAVPARTTTRTWDTAHVWQTETIQQGTTTLAKRAWKTDAEGRVIEESRNDALTTRYEYETVETAGIGGTVETCKVRKYERAFGAAQGTERLVSETTTDHLGRLVSSTGPGVVEERRTYTVLPNGQTLEAVKRGSETDALQQILTQRIVDALGRTVREKVNVPLGVERSWEYDAFGRVTREELSSVPVELVRAYSYSGAVITERAYPGNPELMRTTVRSARLEGSYAVERVQTGNRFEERWTKLGLLAAGELGETKVVRNGGEEIKVQTEIDTNTHTITEKRYRAGVTNADMTESRAGAVMRTTNGAEGTTLTRTIVDALGRPEYEVLLPQNRTTTYLYDYATGGVASTNLSAPAIGALGFAQTYHPATDAAFGRVKTRTEAGLTTNYVYSARGELRGTWGATYPVRYTYDLAGRLVKMETYRQVSGIGSNPVAQWPAGDKTEWVYHPGTMALQQKKDAAGKGALYTYEARGPVLTREWARLKAGSTTEKVKATYAHNELGELKSISYNDGTPNVALLRDSLGRIVTMTEGANTANPITRTFAYNTAGLLAEESGAGAPPAFPHILTRGYDAVGRAQGMVLEMGAGGVATWQGWDYDGATGQVAGLSLPVGRMVRSFSAVGQDTALQLDGAMTHRISDAFGRTTTTTASVAAGSPVVTTNVARYYGYNALNQRDSMTDERSDKWLYTYDGKSQVTGGTKKWSTNQADTGTFYGQTVAGTVHSYAYDEIGNRTSWTTPGGSGYAGQMNNLNQMTSRINNGSAEVTGEADPAATVKVNTQLATREARGYFEKSVGYSSYYGNYYGELRSVNVEEIKGGQTTAQPSHIWLPKQYEGPTYDLDGNLTSDSRWSYTWDAENRLTKMETNASAPSAMPRVRLTFTYDAHWRRVGKKVETKNASNVWVFTRELKNVYDGWNLIAEFEALPAQPTTFNLRRTHHWGPDLSGTAQGAGGVGGLVLTRQHSTINSQPSITSYLPAYDGNGNIVALLDIDTAEKAAEYEYGPFGEPLRATGPMAKANPFRFSTKYTDEETGLCYYGYRYYQPQTGRWINRDPIEERGGLHLYGLLDNNPMGKIDHLGLKRCEREVVFGHGRGGGGKGGVDVDYRKKSEQSQKGKNPTRTCYVGCGSNTTNDKADEEDFGIGNPPQNKWPKPGTPWPPTFNNGNSNPNAPDHGPGWPDIPDDDYLPEEDDDGQTDESRTNDAIAAAGEDGCYWCCKVVQIKVKCEPLSKFEKKAGRTLPSQCGKTLFYDCSKRQLRNY